ncbi:hypothetical protein ACLOJK_021082 [Asimina triloba]
MGKRQAGRQTYARNSIQKAQLCFADYYATMAIAAVAVACIYVWTAIYFSWLLLLFFKPSLQTRYSANLYLSFRCWCVGIKEGHQPYPHTTSLLSWELVVRLSSVLPLLPKYMHRRAVAVSHREMAALNECREGLLEALNTRVYGNGSQALVLSHGFGLNQGVWHYILPYLVCYFKVVVFDMPFSGTVSPDVYDGKRYSTFNGYANDLCCLLDQLNVTSSIYLGHSMSAMIGCIAATQRPDLFKHLLLLGGSPRYPIHKPLTSSYGFDDRYLNGEGYEGGFEKGQIDELLHQIECNFSTWIPTFAPVAVGVNNSKAIEEFESSLGGMKPEIAYDVLRNVFLGDYRWVLPQVQIPCTIITSEKDFVVPTSVAFYTKRSLGGNATVEILQADGHLPMLTAHRLLLDVLKTVLGF